MARKEIEKRVALPKVYDRDYLMWLADRMIHVYRIDPNDPVVNRLVGVAQVLVWNHSTTIINNLPSSGSLHSAYDGEFLHALATLLIEKFREPTKSDIVIRLRAIANALPSSQASR